MFEPAYYIQHTKYVLFSGILLILLVTNPPSCFHPNYYMIAIRIIILQTYTKVYASKAKQMYGSKENYVRVMC